jgi:hypothetical protein
MDGCSCSQTSGSTETLGISQYYCSNKQFGRFAAL